MTEFQEFPGDYFIFFGNKFDNYSWIAAINLIALNFISRKL